LLVSFPENYPLYHMKQIYGLCAALLGAGLSGTPAAAQHIWTDVNNLAPYTQNFNSLTGTAGFTNNTTTNLRGVYAEAEFPTFTYSPPSFAANDGSNTNANYYHFGDATGALSADRSFGGIAATTTGDGIGHVGIRLKNGTNATIRNLDIVYAMEHWYNSGKQDRARVDVSYRKSAVGGTVTSLFNGSGTWTSIADLGVDAPSTATVIASRDGNSPTNRRVRQATLSSIDLLPNQEIMIRWSYVLNNTTNGNGLSIDDVTISAFTNVFYSSLTNSNLDDVATWSTTADGSGARPSNFSFSMPNATYYVQGNTTGTNTSASRIGSASANATWTVNGANSKIVVGLPGATTTTPTRLYLANNDYIAGRVEVESNATLTIQQPAYAFTFGELDPVSTVEYITTGNPINIAPVAYGNLKLTGASEKMLVGNTLVNSNLIFASATGSTAPDLFLNDYNLTLLRGGQIQGYTPTAFVVTNGKGSLKQSVANTGLDVLFPVGSSATSYTPAWLQQPSSTTARNEDVFSVRVLDKMYVNYDASENGITELLNQNVKKTWLVDEEVLGNSNVTMALQWNLADQMSGGAEGTNFDRTKSYITHYITTGAKPYFDKAAPTAATTVTTPNNSYKLTRAGLTSFSPYAISSNAAAPLPVELVAFGAARTDKGVQCTWKTASEKNNSHFEVERSHNKQQFEKISTVAGAGTSASSHSYSVLDTQAPTSTLYYRLRQVDEDGAATYSPVAVVQGCTNCVAAQATLAVVPNPSSGHVQVLASNGAAIPLFGALYTVHGAARLLLAGATTLDLRDQPAGVYVLHLRTEQGPVSLRVVKE
jgi:hypothetical protein